MNYTTYLLGVTLLLFLLSGHLLGQHQPIIPRDEHGDHHNCGIKYHHESMDYRAKPATSEPVKLTWPVRQAKGFDDPCYWSITNYVDHEPGPGVKDYEGGKHSYNGHKGVDIATFPFAWKKVEEDAVEVIAAAPGIVEMKLDGSMDNDCDLSGHWNAIYIRHQDGSLAIYGHMKAHSLTKKKIGQRVKRGEYLGVVASSGHSTGPHLHFELRGPQGEVIDPFFGPFNPSIQESRWVDQETYWPSGLSYFMTSREKTQPWSVSCPLPEEVKEVHEFKAGERVYFTRMYHNEKPGFSSEQRILRPDGSVWTSWTHTSVLSAWATWWVSVLELPLQAPAGTWVYEITSNEVVYRKEFVVHNVKIDCHGDVEGTAEVDVCGVCVGGNTGLTTLDQDGDGYPDCYDECPLDPEKAYAGNCGCGVPENCHQRCQQAQEYDPSLVYKEPEIEVKFDGKLWSNKWYTMGEYPELKPWGVWTLVDYCDATPLHCATTPEWNAEKVYAEANHRVVLDGKRYRNLWWTAGQQPGEAEVWFFEGPCGEHGEAKSLEVELDHLQFGPNPVHELLYADFSSFPSDTPLEIMDAKGSTHRATMLHSDTESTISMEGIPQGAFFVRRNGQTVYSGIKLD